MEQGQGNPIQRPERLRGRLEFPDMAYFELRGREDYPELLVDGKRTTEALYAKLGGPCLQERNRRKPKPPPSCASPWLSQGVSMNGNSPGSFRTELRAKGPECCCQIPRFLPFFLWQVSGRLRLPSVPPAAVTLRTPRRGRGPMGDCERNVAAVGSGNDQVPADLPRTPRKPGGEARGRRPQPCRSEAEARAWRGVPRSDGAWY